MLIRVPLTVKLVNQPPLQLTVSVNHPSMIAYTAELAARFRLGDTTNRVEYIGA